MQEDTIQSWLSEISLPEGFSLKPGIFSSIDSPGAMVRDYQAMVQGQEGKASLPTEETSSDDRAKFIRRSGEALRPKAAEDYDVPEYPDPVFSSVMTKARQAAYDNGLAPETWNALSTALAELVKEERAQAAQELADLQTAWKSQNREKYGSRWPEVEALVEREFLKLFPDEESRQTWGHALKATGEFEKPMILDLLLRVAESTGEDKMPTEVEKNPLSERNEAIKIARTARKLLKEHLDKSKSPQERADAAKRYDQLHKALMDQGYEKGAADPQLAGVEGT